MSKACGGAGRKKASGLSGAARRRRALEQASSTAMVKNASCPLLHTGDVVVPDGDDAGDGGNAASGSVDGGDADGSGPRGGPGNLGRLAQVPWRTREPEPPAWAVWRQQRDAKGCFKPGLPGGSGAAWRQLELSTATTEQLHLRAERRYDSRVSYSAASSSHDPTRETGTQTRAGFACLPISWVQDPSPPPLCMISDDESEEL